MTSLRLFFSIPAFWLAMLSLSAQDLTPRAYRITPVRSNAVTLTYSFSSGSIFADSNVPVTDFLARYHAEVLSYYHSFDFLGRSANVTGSLPYARGNFEGRVANAENNIYRSGLADMRLRLSVNVLGAPAMSVKEFFDWREKSTVGVSLTVVAPTGQYDPARLINPGSNRWAAKPELGFAKRWGVWTVDLYAGAWFFRQNAKFFPGSNTRGQTPVAAGEAHLTHNLTRRCWLSLDGNYWIGGRTKINGVTKSDLQKNSRLGTTFAIPLNSHQSLKLSYSAGSYVSIGGDYQNISVAWQYSWIRGL